MVVVFAQSVLDLQVIGNRFCSTFLPCLNHSAFLLLQEVDSSHQNVINDADRVAHMEPVGTGTITHGHGCHGGRFHMRHKASLKLMGPPFDVKENL